MSASHIIHSLGGDRAVAEAAGVACNTVTHWRRRDSIPKRHWSSLLSLAGASAPDILSALVSMSAAIGRTEEAPALQRRGKDSSDSDRLVPSGALHGHDHDGKPR